MLSNGGDYLEISILKELKKNHNDCYRCFCDQRRPKTYPKESIRFRTSKRKFRRNVPPSYINKRLTRSRIINRSILTPVEHIKLLSAPKTIPTPQQEKKSPRLKSPERIFQLSTPKPVRFLHTWREYYHILPKKNVERMATKWPCNYVLSVEEAQPIFNDEARKRQKSKPRKKAKTIPLDGKTFQLLRKTIFNYSVILANNLCDAGVRKITHYQLLVSFHIARHLRDVNLIQCIPNHKTTCPFERGLLTAIHKAALFGTNIIDYVTTICEPSTDYDSTIEEISLREPSIFEFFPSEFEFGIFEAPHLPKTPSIVSTFIEHEESIKDMELMNYEAIRKPEFSMDALITHVSEYYHSKNNDSELRVFSAGGLPNVRYGSMLEKLKNIHAEREREKEMKRLKEEYGRKLKLYVTEVNPEALDTSACQTIDFAAEKLAKETLEGAHKIERSPSQTTIRTICSTKEKAAQKTDSIGSIRTICSNRTARSERLTATFSYTTISESSIGSDEEENLSAEKIENLQAEKPEDTERISTAEEEKIEENEKQQLHTDEETAEAVSAAEETKAEEEEEKGVEVEVQEQMDLLVEEKEEVIEEKLEAEEEKIESEDQNEEKAAVNEEKIEDKEEEEEKEGEENEVEKIGVEEEDIQEENITEIKEEAEKEHEEEEEEMEAIASELEVAEKEHEEEEMEDIASELVVTSEVDINVESKEQLEEETTIKSKEEIVENEILVIEPKKDKSKLVEKLTAEKINVQYKLNIMPHSKDTVCCAAIKAWASWIKDVADNNRKWCMWMLNTVDELRCIIEALRGEAYDDDGRPKSFHRHEWNDFVVRLDQDIVQWRHYNQHIQKLAKEVSRHFHLKRVACCYLCELENYNVRNLDMDHTCEQLTEAIETVQYWNKWLGNLISEVEGVTEAIDEMDVGRLMGTVNVDDLMRVVEGMLGAGFRDRSTGITATLSDITVTNVVANRTKQR